MKRWLALALALALASPASAQFDPIRSGVAARTTVAASSLVVKTGAGGLFSAYANGTAAGWLMVFDATAAPADGTVTPLAVCAGAINVGCTISFADVGIAFSTGLVLVYSSTGPFTKTASATAFISAQYQ